MQVNLHEVTSRIEFKKGVRQGDTLSLKIFITVLETFRTALDLAFKTLDLNSRSINIDGQNQSHHRFKDNNLTTTELMI